MTNASPSPFAVQLAEIAWNAGEIILRHYEAGVEARRKEDQSPVTAADEDAERYILEKLRALRPDVPVVAEEEAAAGKIQQIGAHFFLVDPLDGTRAFVRGEPEFTVNIGLIHQRRPVLGVIYAPPQKTLYYGQPGAGAFRQNGDEKPQEIKARKPAADGLVVVRSRSHPSAATSAYLQSLSIKEMLPGSSSIKFCSVAEGSADLYLRFGRTMEWDTAAGHAVLAAAGWVHSVASTGPPSICWRTSGIGGPP